MQSTILSRFDLIFIVKDERSADRDKMIARHVLDVHRTAGAQGEADEEDKKVDKGAKHKGRCATLSIPGNGNFQPRNGAR